MHATLGPFKYLVIIRNIRIFLRAQDHSYSALLTIQNAYWVVCITIFVWERGEVLGGDRKLLGKNLENYKETITI